MLPSLFIPHGSPMIAITNNEYTKKLRQLGESLSPSAIVIFSAHFESEITSITYTDDVYELIYDFRGFPDALYQTTYEVRGSVSVAEKLSHLLQKQGIKTQFNSNRGLDHGVWTPLVHLFPKASVPVVAVSVNPNLPFSDQLAIGQAIQSLKEDNVLIIGSGVTVHNFSELNFNANEPKQWAVNFDDWLLEHIEQKDYDSISNCMNLAPNAKRAIPTKEHFVPLLIALGSGLQPMEVLYRGYEYGTLSYLLLKL